MSNVRYSILDALYAGRTFTTQQVRGIFGVQNVAARIHELRNEGFAIYTNRKTRLDGSKVNVYRLGSASSRYLRNDNAGRSKLAVKSLYTRAA